MTDTPLAALRRSVEGLRGLATPLAEAELTRGAYPSEWTIADVLSHLGSGAVITQRRLEDSLAGAEMPDDFAPGVWDTWNAKTPAAQRTDALAADAALLARMEALPPTERESFAFAMGPMHFDFDGFVALRLNEHAFHTWDIAVALDPGATIPEPVAAFVVDQLDLVARYTAKPTEDTATIIVSTTAPERRFTIELTPESVTFNAAETDRKADVELPAEAFARLVYGRLESAHVSGSAADHPAVEELRRVFPGP
jgi:uncharacterized protein (TIGR03083 family)